MKFLAANALLLAAAFRAPTASCLKLKGEPAKKRKTTPRERRLGKAGGEPKCATGGQVALDCDPSAKGNKPQSCCDGLACRNIYCNYALEGYASAQCNGGPNFPIECAPGLGCSASTGLCSAPAVPTDDCCNEWCNQHDIFGWLGGTPWYSVDSFTLPFTVDCATCIDSASCYPVTGGCKCSSSNGCDCVITAGVEPSYSVENGAVCGAHSLHETCNVDGGLCEVASPTHCVNYQVYEIDGRIENDECFCYVKYTDSSASTPIDKERALWASDHPTESRCKNKNELFLAPENLWRGANFCPMFP